MKEEEKTKDINITAKIQNTLDDFMRRVIRPQLDYTVEMRWSGIMGMGERNLLPLIRQHAEGVFVAARCNGMGVAMGIQTAADLNDLLTSC